jgi:fucose 4-O-acetylase-like acetyltransferase
MGVHSIFEYQTYLPVKELVMVRWLSVEHRIEFEMCHWVLPTSGIPTVGTMMFMKVAADDLVATDAVTEQLEDYDLHFSKRLGSQVMTVGMIHLHRIRYPLYVVMTCILDTMTMTIMILRQDSGR